MLYAAYGSNLHPARLRARAPQARLLGTAAVAGRVVRFHKRSVDGSGKCNVTAGDGRIHVAVYELTTEDKAKLDRAEGVGTGYRIDSLELPEHGRCFTYIATDTYIDDSLKPYFWYKQLVIAGCEYLSFPDFYVDAIAAVESVADPNRIRHSMNMAIVEKARSLTRQGLPVASAHSPRRRQ